MTIRYTRDQSSASDLVGHLECCSDQFIPALADRVNVADYAKKLHCNATRFEAWHEGELVGLVAAYFSKSDANSETPQPEHDDVGFISNVSVLRQFGGRGIATNLVQQTIQFSKDHRVLLLELKVNRDNDAAVSLYGKLGFCIAATEGTELNMRLEIGVSDEV
ncbi:GNAT family N-acetyltransferase [Stieleria sp. JC731]|uniref:GNAT family N-acetyltransferase n=1 Tax=Pirellulaceae TaxID=2691357 RepID=UPI001E643861|nr:GNAT family N-acetyltransferase [Stieleria sp. JC731]MCC9602038.1 GNAT family N-acetyltransferase [Stieleria sp. JC731]